MKKLIDVDESIMGGGVKVGDISIVTRQALSSFNIWGLGFFPANILTGDGRKMKVFTPVQVLKRNMPTAFSNRTSF